MAIKPLNSVAGFSVGETPTSIILANGDVSANNFTVTGTSNLNSISNITITGGSSGQVIQTDGSGVLSFVTLNTSQLANGNSNIQVYSNGNVAISSTGNANVLVVTGSGANITGTLSTSGNVSALGLLTNNLYYANGQPWDLQEAAGSNTQIQYNDGLNNFGASANFTWDYAGNVLTVGGNANVTNTLKTNQLQLTSVLSQQILYSNGSSYAVGSANYTFNDSTNLLTLTGNTSITGNANIGNIGTGGIVTASGTVTGGNLATAGTLSAGGNANIGNIGTGIITATGTITGGNLATAGTLSAGGNSNVGNLGAAFITATGNIEGANVVGSNVYVTSLTTGQLAISTASGQLVGGPDLLWEFNNAALFTTALKSNGYITASGNITGGNLVTGGLITATGNLTAGNIITGGTISATGNANAGNIGVTGVYSSTMSASGNASVGGILTDNYYYANGSPVDFQQPAGSNTQVQFNNNNDFGASANFTFDTATNLLTVNGNAQFNNANLGNVATANYVNVASNVTSNNITVNLALSGNTANFSNNVIANGLTVNNNISGNTANFSGNVIVPNLTVNLELAGNTANFTGNVVAANFIGSLANGLSEVKVYNNANVEFTINGSSNLVSITTTGIYVDGEIQTTAGNVLSNGNVTANGFLNGANANVTGQGTFGSVVTANITAPTGNITISAAGTDENIILAPSGNGTVDVGLHKITQVGDPTNPHDAVTKEYVDNIAQGLSVHPAVKVTSTTNLNATYTDGGTALTTTTISGGKTITFSANHGLSVGDEIYWTNSFNGIIANDSYFVYSIPALNQITVKAGFYGAEVTTLTNGTGLTQPALANSGVGATLTNAGANAALSIDSIALSGTDRVLVQGQTNAWENGVYVVTTVGAPDSPGPGSQWVLTRSSDTDNYDPKSLTGLGYGDYFFVQEGTNAAGSSYILTTPTGEIIFGVTNIGFTQFSAAGAYTAGSGINISGTIISANTDNITTDIVGGNIVVKASAQLTTPNIDAATGTSLSVTGNVTANNLSVANIANISANLIVEGYIQANGNISSNNWVNANNIFVTSNVSAQGNALIGNITANGLISSNTANVTANLITGNLTVNNEFSGNTANFSGNVILPNLTVNLQLSGNTANFTGTANAGNFSTGGLVTATGNITGGNLVTGGVLSVTGNANIGNVGTGIVLATGNITASNFISNGAANIATNLNIGNSTVNTTITWDSVTTTAVTANQTIASFSVSGITGVEYLVKGIDATGGKYSVATVQAVTDGVSEDYATFGTVQLGGYTGSLAVNISGGFIRLQVTPSSSNSTVWTTQYRLI